VAHQRPEKELARRTTDNWEEIARLTVQLGAAHRRIGSAEAMAMSSKIIILKRLRNLIRQVALNLIVLIRIE
jgi:hypothetical protein